MVVLSNYVYVAGESSGFIILRLLIDKVAASIPVSGGSLSSSDRETDLIFPSGTFTQTVIVTYRELLDQKRTQHIR